jgi:hypothetical protein
LDELKGAEARYCKDLTVCQAKVEEFQISETKYESLFDETIITIKERERAILSFQFGRSAFLCSKTFFSQIFGSIQFVFVILWNIS